MSSSSRRYKKSGYRRRKNKNKNKNTESNLSKRYYILKNKRWYYYYLNQKNDNYKKTDRKIGLLDEYDETTMENGLVIQLTTSQSQYSKLRLFSYFSSIVDFMRYESEFNIRDRGFFETTLGQYKQKPRFDLDIDTKEDETIIKSVQDKNIDQLMEDMITYIVFGIKRTFETFELTLNMEEDILLFSSHGKHKRSYHIVINNYCHKNCEEADNFYKVVVRHVPPFFHRWIDHAVYKSLQQFRIEGSQKIGSDRIKRLNYKWKYGPKDIHTKIDMDVVDKLNDSDKIILNSIKNESNSIKERYAILYASLLTNVYHCKILPDFSKLLPLEETKLPNEYLNNIDSDIAIAGLHILADRMGINISSSKFPYKFKKIVAGGIIILERKMSSYCDVCDRIHDKENPYMYIINGVVYFDCRRNQYNKRTKIGQVYKSDDGYDITDQNLTYMPTLKELDDMDFVIPTVDENGNILSNDKNINSNENIVSNSSNIPNVNNQITIKNINRSETVIPFNGFFPNKINTYNNVNAHKINTLDDLANGIGSKNKSSNHRYIRS